MKRICLNNSDGKLKANWKHKLNRTVHLFIGDGGGKCLFLHHSKTLFLRNHRSWKMIYTCRMQWGVGLKHAARNKTSNNHSSNRWRKDAFEENRDQLKLVLLVPITLRNCSDSSYHRSALHLQSILLLHSKFYIVWIFFFMIAIIFTDKDKKKKGRCNIFI